MIIFLSSSREPLSLVFILYYVLLVVDDGSISTSSPQTSVGQVSRVDVSSKVEVVWADNSMTIVLPQVNVSPL